jgi:hypothetical protein
MIPKNQKMSYDEFQKILFEFNNDLINYSVYFLESEKSERIRAILMKKILLPSEFNNDVNNFKHGGSRCSAQDERLNLDKNKVVDSDDIIDDLLDDPEKIGELWEEAEGSIHEEPL